MLLYYYKCNLLSIHLNIIELKKKKKTLNIKTVIKNTLYFKIQTSNQELLREKLEIESKFKKVYILFNRNIIGERCIPIWFI